jgi:hypothetical protein
VISLEALPTDTSVEPKHTPGPWFVDWDGKDVAVFAKDNIGEPLLTLRSAKNLLDKDANLVAAAPDLLLALERVEHALGLVFSKKPLRDMSETLAEARAAIKKAKGE